MTKRLYCVALTAVLALLSGCQSPTEATDSQVLPSGQSWAEQREQAKSKLAGNPSPPDSGTAIDAAVIDPGGRRMSVTFTGAAEPATASCGIDYSAEAVESAAAVVIIVLEQHHSYDEVCTLEGVSRTATVNLAQPLAGRTVLGLRGPGPVPVSTAPVAQ